VSLAPGTSVGRYRIVAALGAGGMGEVYRALDTRLKREVALKILPTDLVVDPDRKRRFLLEAQSAAALSHPRIATVYDADEADGVCYLAMELVAGVPLTERLHHGPMPAGEALAVAVEVGEGLACAHAKGIVHRDLKPANVLIDTDGHARLIDFGVAKLLEPWSGETTTDLATLAGRVVGTPAYMAPEQARGMALDARADVFSFGLLVYELLTRRRPFDRGSWSDTVAAVLRDPAPPLAAGTAGLATGVLSSLQRLLDHCLAKEMTDRPASMVEVLRELEAIRRLAEGGSPTLSAVPTEQASIVVLPFENLSPDPDNAFFADGLTEELIADLSKIQSLRVISRTSAMHYKGTTKPLPVIAQELSVRHVLEGSVRRAGSNLRITAQLIDAATDAHRWAEKYTGTLDDVFDLQERLSRRIVDALRVSLTPAEDRELAARPIQDIRAYDAWLRATTDAWSFTPGGFDRAFQHLHRALEIVGDNALLHAGLGYFHSLAYDTGIRHDPETLARAEFHATRALELDPDLGQAHLAMAWVLYKRGGLSAGMRMMRRAAEKDRSIDALVLLAFGLGEAGRVAESRQLAQELVAADPLNQFAGFARGGAEFWDGRFDEAAMWFRKYLDEVAPGSPLLLWWLAQALAYGGRDVEARDLFNQVAGMEAGVLSDLSALHCLAADGDCDGLRDALRANTVVQEAAKTDEWFPNFIAACLARVGDHDSAIDWLEQATNWGFCNGRFLGEVSPFLTPLRGTPRFEALMQVVREKERAFEA
jgi:serine/threonine protein kinase